MPDLCAHRLQQVILLLDFITIKTNGINIAYRYIKFHTQFPSIFDDQDYDFVLRNIYITDYNFNKNLYILQINLKNIFLIGY